LCIVLFVIGSRFLTVYPLLALSGSGRRTSFIASLNLSQISEFSLVIASLGVAYGHLQEHIMSLVIYAMAVTSVISSYMIKANHQLYLLFNRMLQSIGLGGAPDDMTSVQEEAHYPVVILGFHRGAAALVRELGEMSQEMLKKILVIDFNLEVLKELKGKGVKGIFGDISSLDTLEHAHIQNARIILSTIPDMLLKGANNLSIVRTCRAIAPHAEIVATAESTRQIENLKNAGATEVILPYSMIGSHLANYLMQSLQRV